MFLGNQYEFVRLTVKLVSIGPIALIIGRGVVLVMGECTGGPAMEVVGLSSIADTKAIFKGGAAEEAAEQAIRNGASAVYLIRIMGQGYDTAYANADDGLSPANTVGEFTATSDGVESIVVVIEDGIYTAFEYEEFIGDETVGPYYLQYANLEEEEENRVIVGAEEKNPVYDPGELGEGDVYIDSTNGSLLFFAGEGPLTSEKISVYYEHKSISLAIYSGVDRPLLYKNIRSLAALKEALRYCGVCTFEPTYGETHLPAIGTYVLEGGDEGATPTLEDWDDGFDIALELPEGVIPTTTVITSYEVEEGTYDLIARFDGFVSMMAGKFTPTLGFVSVAKGETVRNVKNLVNNFNNMFLTIIINGWDENEADIAPARAGKEASVELGESTAEEINSLNNVDGLLWTLNPTDLQECTYNGIDVLIKSRGIRPYVGISTNTDDNFRRNVDIRTIAECLILLKAASDYFKHKARTRRNLDRLFSTLDLMYRELRNSSALDDHEVAILPNKSDKNPVDIEIMLQPVGRLERFRATMSVGYYSTEIAE